MFLVEQKDVGSLFDWIDFHCTSRHWLWRTPPSMGHLSIASVWQRTRLWTWNQGIMSLLGCLSANSGGHCLILQNHLFLTLSLCLLPSTGCISLVYPVAMNLTVNLLFGLSVDHQKPVVCSSCLDNDRKALLSQSLAAVGGNLVSSWSHECTHLVMTSVKVTIKVRISLCYLMQHDPKHLFMFFMFFSTDYMCSALLSPHCEAGVLLRTPQSHWAKVTPS